MKRVCPECNSEFDGRIDKKFCCDQCRNTYNNRLKADELNFSRGINKILRTNRNILAEMYESNKNYKITKNKLIANGFNFNYLTNIYKTKNDKTYYYCYDFGYIVFDDDSISIFQRKDYVE